MFKKNKKNSPHLVKSMGSFFMFYDDWLTIYFNKEDAYSMIIERFCFLAPNQKSYIKNHPSVIIYFRTQTADGRLDLLECLSLF